MANFSGFLLLNLFRKCIQRFLFPKFHLACHPTQTGNFLIKIFGIHRKLPFRTYGTNLCKETGKEWAESGEEVRLHFHLVAVLREQGARRGLLGDRLQVGRKRGRGGACWHCCGQTSTAQVIDTQLWKVLQHGGHQRSRTCPLFLVIFWLQQ